MDPVHRKLAWQLRVRLQDGPSIATVRLVVLLFVLAILSFVGGQAATEWRLNHVRQARLLDICDGQNEVRGVIRAILQLTNSQPAPANLTPEQLARRRAFYTRAIELTAPKNCHDLVNK